MKYSLAKYSMSISSIDGILQQIFGESLTIGGQGSMTGSISIRQNTSPSKLDGYTTGGYVYSASFDRTGSISVSINQMSDAVSKFKQLLKAYYQADFEPFTITVSDNEGNQVAECIDCNLRDIPEQSFGSDAADQTWSFDCGRITFN